MNRSYGNVETAAGLAICCYTHTGIYDHKGRQFVLLLVHAFFGVWHASSRSTWLLDAMPICHAFGRHARFLVSYCLAYGILGGYLFDSCIRLCAGLGDDYYLTTHDVVDEDGE